MTAKKPSPASDRRASMLRAEEAMTDLLYYAEHFSNTGISMHDWKFRRRDLLAAARRYGKAMDSLARLRK